MLVFTDIKYRDLSLTDVRYSQYVFSDVVLLNDIRFFTLEDLAEATDFVQIELLVTNSDFSTASDEIMLGYTSQQVDSFEVVEVVSMQLTTSFADQSIATDVCSVVVARSMAEVVAVGDTFFGGSVINISDFVSVNESVNFGQNSEISVNNIVSPIDDISYSYTDGKQSDSAAVSDDLNLVLRPYGSSLLASSLLGNIILGA